MILSILCLYAFLGLTVNLLLIVGLALKLIIYC
jgi:hypothetical protein